MAQAILLSGGAGGVSSDDVTASKAQVLQGYKTVTTDSNDEVVEGTIPKRGTWSTASEVVNASGESTVHVRFEEGYYNKDGQYKPTAKIPYAVLTNVLGIDANKILDTLTVAGVRGTIPVRGYRGPDCTDMFMYQPDGGYVIRIEEGYYHMGGNRQWKPYVIVSPALAKSAVNYHPEKTLSDTRTCEEQGQVKMINTQDNGYTINQAKVLAIDGGRGKLVMIMGHGNAYYHRPDGNPHVEANASELGDVTADKVMRGFTATSKHGIKFAGTMPDLQSGRTVFNGATFDNELVSGVASKSFYFNRELYSYQIANGYGYAGVYGGGMNLALRTSSPELRGRKIGCVLSQSNNLTPFKRIVVDYRTTGNISGNPTINFYAFIAPARALIRSGFEFNGARVDGFSQISTQVMASARQGQLVIDTSNINEQAFLGFYASANASGAENFNGAVQITKIEFFN